MILGGGKGEGRATTAFHLANLEMFGTFFPATSLPSLAFSRIPQRLHESLNLGLRVIDAGQVMTAPKCSCYCSFSIFCFVFLYG